MQIAFLVQTIVETLGEGIEYSMANFSCIVCRRRREFNAFGSTTQVEGNNVAPA